MYLPCLAVALIINNFCEGYARLTLEKQLPPYSSLVADEEELFPNIEDFPDVEYPQSVLESVPFFYKPTKVLDPFSKDVRNSFKSIVENTKKPENESPPPVYTLENYVGAKSMIESNENNIKNSEDLTEGFNKPEPQDSIEESVSDYKNNELDEMVAEIINNTDDKDSMKFLTNTSGNYDQNWIGEDDNEKITEFLSLDVNLDNHTITENPVIEQNYVQIEKPFVLNVTEQESAVSNTDFDDLQYENYNTTEENVYQIEKPLLMNDTKQETKYDLLPVKENTDMNVNQESISTEITLPEPEISNITAVIEQESPDEKQNIEDNELVTFDKSLESGDQIENIMFNTTEHSERKKRSYLSEEEGTSNDFNTENKIENNTSKDSMFSTKQMFDLSEAVLRRPELEFDDDDGIIIENREGFDEDIFVAPICEENCVINKTHEKENIIKDL